jgi:two-component system chemotaxis sensor kinase CheA
VDEVIGQYQTVIKRLGKFYEGTIGFAGATILGDGSVAMIIDTAGLIEAVEKKAK